MLSIFCRYRFCEGLQTIDCSQRMPYLNQSNGNISVNFSVCIDSNMTVISGLKQSDIGILNLSSTSLLHTQDGWLKHFTNLSKLDLQNNSLSELTDKSFVGLTSLKYLDLSSNSFVRLKQGWFKMLNSLETLIMNNCGIKFFEPAQFAWPDRLFDLSLKDNMIPVMPPLPLATKNYSRWTVHLEGNDISCKCRREEHTKDTVKIETYCRIHSICLTQAYSKKLDKPLYCNSSRLNLIWKKYFSTPVCSGPVFKIDCNITGKCTVKWDAIPKPKQNLSFFDLGHCVSSENKGVCAFKLEEVSAGKCKTNMTNLNSSATTNYETRETTTVITTVITITQYKQYMYLLFALSATLVTFIFVVCCYFCCTKKKRAERIKYIEHRYVQRHVHMTEPIYEVIKEGKINERKQNGTVEKKTFVRGVAKKRMENKYEATTNEERQESDIIDNVSDVIDGSDVDSFTYSKSTSGSSYTDTSGESFEPVYVSSCDSSTSHKG